MWVGSEWSGTWELKRDCMLTDDGKFVLTPKKNNTTSTTNASGITDQIDLMALKALGTLYFALIAAAVYFTQFYFGGEEGNWVTLMLSMVDEVPVFDIRNVMNLLDLRYVFSWPTMDVAFETPMVLSVGVLVMQYSTDLVRTLYVKYFQATDKVTSKDFARPMLLIIAAFSPGVWAQQGFQFVWDLGFGAWCCFGPLTRCCVKMRCFHAKGVGRFAYPSDWGIRCRRCCQCLCGDGSVQGRDGRGGTAAENALNEVILNGTAASILTRKWVKGKQLRSTVELMRLWTAGSAESLAKVKELDLKEFAKEINELPELIGKLV